MDSAKGATTICIGLHKAFQDNVFKIPRAQTVEDHLVVAVGIDVRSGMIIKTKH